MTDRKNSVPDDNADRDNRDLDDLDDNPAEGDDIELVTSWLNGHLDPEQAAAVERRLQEDSAFRDLAGPLILVWSVPRHIERYPRPEGEWERSFEEFKRRTGFPERRPPKPPKRRYPWRRWLTVALVTIGVVTFCEPRRRSGADALQYSQVPYTPGWSTLNDGIDVQLARGAVLNVAHRRVDNRRRVRLEGSARFRILPIDANSPTPRAEVLVIETRAGLVKAGESDFTVIATADTTLVFVHPFGRQESLRPFWPTVTTSTDVEPTRTVHLPLRVFEGARLVTGHDPQHILPRP